MKMGRALRSRFEQAVARDEYWEAGAILEFTVEMARAMKEQGVSNSELARRIGTSPAYITKILRGRSNFTVRSMARIARALGGSVKIHIAPAASVTRWLDFPASTGSVATESVEGTATDRGGCYVETTVHVRSHCSSSHVTASGSRKPEAA